MKSCLILAARVGSSPPYSSTAKHPRSETLAEGVREGSSSQPKIPSLGLAGKGNWGNGGEEWAILGQQRKRTVSVQVVACPGNFALGRALPAKSWAMLRPALLLKNVLFFHTECLPLPPCPE